MLRACGFDLSTALVPYDPEAPPLARLVELSRLTHKERLDQAMLRGAHRRLGYTYDPYTVLAQLDEAGVQYILLGALSRVLQGADEIPEDLDLVIPKGTRFATDEAIRRFALLAPRERPASLGGVAGRSRADPGGGGKATGGRAARGDAPRGRAE
ncbi:MAG: hypothetical protein ACKVWR_15430 [Acidimicrobiales bacterium]